MVVAGGGVGEGIGKLCAPWSVGPARSWDLWDLWDPRGKGLRGCHVTESSPLHAQVRSCVSMLRVRKAAPRALSAALVTMGRFQQGNDRKHFHL